MPHIPDHFPSSSDWTTALQSTFQAQWFVDLVNFVDQQRKSHQVFPPAQDVFRAFHLTSLSDVKVCILGQDPYHGAGQAHGLSFSVRDGVKLPPSLKNIYKELSEDCTVEFPTNGNLTAWARQGVLLLNTVLTVRESDANSHRKQGWEQFTDKVIELIAAQSRPLVFVLWGKPAAQKKKMIYRENQLVIETAHPSPLSARLGFFGSKPFSRINRHLNSHGIESIDWSLDD